MVKINFSSIDFDALASRTVDAVRFLTPSREGATRQRGLQSRCRLALTRLLHNVQLSRTRSLVARTTMSARTILFVLLLVDYSTCASAFESRKMFRFGDLVPEASLEKLEESDFGEELCPDALAVSFGTLKGPATARARANLSCISHDPV